jgi:prephenate dehydrogenase
VIQSGFARRVIGVDSSPEHAQEALRRRFVNGVASLEEAVAQADLTIVAVPVDAALDVIPRVLDLIKDVQVVTDMCSTKRSIMKRIEAHPNRSRFVGGHPMAGTEQSGPAAALQGLFHGKTGVLCDLSGSAPDAVEKVRALYRALGLMAVEMDAAQHDCCAAYVSHMPHVLSYALALTALQKEEQEPRLFEMAGGGFSSMARLARSGADMWAPVLLENADQTIIALDACMARLVELRRAIAARDVAAVCRIIHAANKISRVAHI